MCRLSADAQLVPGRRALERGPRDQRHLGNFHDRLDHGRDLHAEHGRRRRNVAPDALPKFHAPWDVAGRYLLLCDCHRVNWADLIGVRGDESRCAALAVLRFLQKVPENWIWKTARA